MESASRESFIQDLFKKQNENSVTVGMKYFTADGAKEPDTLLNLLSLNEGKLNDEGKLLIDYLETTPKENDVSHSYENFKWKLSAFLAVQDVFDLKVHGDFVTENLLQLRYFYYESKYVLTESIVTSLNGSHIGNKHLMRNFLEFNLLQNYFIRENDKSGSFKPINTYFTYSAPK